MLFSHYSITSDFFLFTVFRYDRMHYAFVAFPKNKKKSTKQCIIEESGSSEMDIIRVFYMVIIITNNIV